MGPPILHNSLISTHQTLRPDLPRSQERELRPGLGSHELAAQAVELSTRCPVMGVCICAYTYIQHMYIYIYMCMYSCSVI